MVTRVSGSEITISHNSQTTTANSTTILTQGLSHPSATGNNIVMHSDGSTRQPGVVFVHGQGMIPSYSNGVTARWTPVINHGNAYNSTNGRFTAPVPGVYMFGIAGIGNTGISSILRWYPFINGVQYEPISGSPVQYRQELETGGYNENAHFNLPIPLAQNDYVHWTANDATTAYGFNDVDNPYHQYYVFLIK